MAMLFMLEERILQKDTHPLLSCSDIESLLRPFCHDAMWRMERLPGKWRKDIENVRQPSSRNTENKHRDNELTNSGI